MCRIGVRVHTEKYIRNLIKSNQNQIVFTIFWLISNQTDVRLVPNESENGKYNLISVWLNKISKRFLGVYKGAKSFPAISCDTVEFLHRYVVQLPERFAPLGIVGA